MSSIYAKYWSDYPKYLAAGDCMRHAFHLDILLKNIGKCGVVVDIGGGWGSFSAGAAMLGMNSILVDDFHDDGFFSRSDIRFQMSDDYGFNVIDCDVIKDGLNFEHNSIDMFTSFDSMEHWHNSPKSLFLDIKKMLRPGGVFFLGVPNSVNLRKRVTTLFGKNKWSSMEDWYEAPVFRGHVREPDIEDLKYIAKDMGLVDVQIIGRNWQGFLSPVPIVRELTSYLDIALRLVPSLCSDIYLIARKPA